MFSKEEVVETFEMIHLSGLNIRTVTLGINLLDCIDKDFDNLKTNIYSKITTVAEKLLEEAESVEHKYGIPIVTKRISVTPIALLLESTIAGLPQEEAETRAIGLAQTLSKATEKIGVDYAGGYSAIVQKGWTSGDIALINSIPKALSSTECVCSCVNIAETRSGINVDAALKMGEVIKKTAELTGDRNGIGCGKLGVYANAPPDTPFMPGAYHGVGEAEATVNVGISGPGVIRVIVEQSEDLDFRALAEKIKRASFKITRVGELIGREVAKRLKVKFGIVDLSVAPTPAKGESIAGIIEAMGIDYCGAPGSTAALALLTDAVKKGGSMATSSVGGMSGAFIPVSEDSGMVKAVQAGALSIEKLEAMTSVCSVGLDMVTIPGDTSAETIAAIILDEMAIGVVNNKPLGVRIIPVPGKKAGDKVEFGGLLGSSVVMPVSPYGSSRFVKRGGQFPSPVNSLTG
ncbi:MAG: PFL family protein [Nitrososphaerales archaeon]